MSGKTVDGAAETGVETDVILSDFFFVHGEIKLTYLDRIS